MVLASFDLLICIARLTIYVASMNDKHFLMMAINYINTVPSSDFKLFDRSKSGKLLFNIV